MAKRVPKTVIKKVGKIEIVRFGNSQFEGGGFGIHFTLF